MNVKYSCTFSNHVKNKLNRDVVQMTEHIASHARRRLTKFGHWSPKFCVGYDELFSPTPSPRLVVSVTTPNENT